MTSQNRTTKSGIITTPTGQRHIPESTRSDGSTRREIKIRPGYRPPEDVAVYKNRTADAWKNRGSGGVPGAAVATDDNVDINDVMGKTTNKNAKRREARKKAKATSEVPAECRTPRSADPGSQAATGPAEEDVAPAAASIDPEAEAERQAKKLQKKLRQARELRQKKDSGESLLPEQLEKVVKMQELIRQLDTLGFDAEGERKKGS
ncbi:MAG: hypothetical protein M1817_002087 [Caeruleum heppii]|nr:MAG: hypothetical protein M1817_002087 [Caeruleum heppii]